MLFRVADRIIRNVKEELSRDIKNVCKKICIETEMEERFSKNVSATLFHKRDSSQFVKR